ncbi:TMEM165/GDT1 family protein [Gudongella sp. SC589]|jgi:putative Ca2+/H+ antiporter (TMEM165/GDT1 family)|uniref:TMEM165/GDT1 family protein n=1 Tax=Gudongella sp. SC589 TaxID=3385990 RepID=UPI003904965B
MVNEFIKASSLIFMAEMGDKTQIIAMTFATQYMVRHVLSGVALGVLANHGIAIVLGALIGSVITGDMVNIIAGGLFIFFGWNALRMEESEDIENKIKVHPVWTVALAFFIGELGDKTQLTAMALSAEAEFPAIILAGTTAGMVATSGLGIFVGSRIGGRIPEIGLKIASSLVFLGFGMTKLYESIGYYLDSLAALAVIFSIVIVVEIVLIRKAIAAGREMPEKLGVKRAAEQLYQMTKRINDELDSVCLGEENCGTCAGVGCLIGYIRSILTNARRDREYFLDADIQLEDLLIRNYEDKKIEDALLLTLQELVDYGWTDEPEFIMTKVRESLEILLFERRIGNTKSVEAYLKEVSAIDYPLGKRYMDILQREASNEKKDN